MIYQCVVVRLTTNYGTLRAVPVGGAARSFANMAGATTLTPRVLKGLAQLGISVRADASGADRDRAEQEWGVIFDQYTSGDELLLDPTIESHIDSKMEHGT